MSNDSVMFLMANLGSEFARLLRARADHHKERMRGAHVRARDILHEVQALPEVKDVQRELSLLREVLDDFVHETPRFHIQSESVRQYFLPFALQILRKKS